MEGGGGSVVLLFVCDSASFNSQQPVRAVDYTMHVLVPPNVCVCV